MHRKIVIVTIVSCIFIGALLYIFSPDFISKAVGGTRNFWFYMVTIVGFILSLVLEYFNNKRHSEYIDANKIAYTPHNIYGVYALIYFVVLIIIFFLYILLTK